MKQKAAFSKLLCIKKRILRCAQQCQEIHFYNSLNANTCFYRR